MSENFADFLNDNVGVVGATAGYAVNRNLAATNRNISALRSEIGRLQEQFAQEQRKEERERLNRDMLFQVSQQVRSLAASHASPEMYFELVQVADDFQSLGFTSATFNSIEDKSFLSAVSGSIDQCFTSMWEAFPDELKEQVAALVDLHYLAEMGDAVAIADKKLPPVRNAFEATLKRAKTLEQDVPRLFSYGILTGIMLGGLLFGALILGISFYSGAYGAMLAQFGVVGLGVSTSAFIIAIIRLGPALKEHTSAYVENSRLSHSRRDQLVFLESQRVALAQRIAQLQNAPAEEVAMLASDLISPDERFVRVDRLFQNVSDLCSKLGVDPRRLPKVAERSAMDRLLARRL